MWYQSFQIFGFPFEKRNWQNDFFVCYISIFLHFLYFILCRSVHCSLNVQRLVSFYSQKMLLQNALKPQGFKKDSTISYDRVFARKFLVLSSCFGVFLILISRRSPKPKKYFSWLDGLQIGVLNTCKFAELIWWGSHEENQKIRIYFHEFHQ